MFGIEADISIGEPNTWREIIVALDQHGPLTGKRVAIQEYGVSNRDLTAALEARDAEVIPVPVYRWTLPLDRAPLRAAIEAITAGRADAVLFTSSNQATNVIRVAEAEGFGERLRHGLASAFVGSIGPVCSEQLRALGIHIDLEPIHPKLGHLLKEMAAAYARLHPRRAISIAPQAALSIADSASALAGHPFMRACRREPTPYTPIWLMRQAGRYMPEYRRVRAKHSFLEMCGTPELAAEVTVTAVERLNVDAAIIFADILLPLVPMDVGLKYEAGDGPTIDHPVRTLADLDRLPPVNPAESLELRWRIDSTGQTRARHKDPADRLRRRAIYPRFLPDRRR